MINTIGYYYGTFTIGYKIHVRKILYSPSPLLYDLTSKKCEAIIGTFFHNNSLPAHRKNKNNEGKTEHQQILSNSFFKEGALKIYLK